MMLSKTVLNTATLKSGPAQTIAKNVGFCSRRGLHSSHILRADGPSLRQAALSTIEKARKTEKVAIPFNSPPRNDAVRRTNFRIAANFGYFKCSLNTAELIVAKVSKRTTLSGKDVEELALKHKVTLGVITRIARLLLRQLHSDEPRRWGSTLLNGCAEAGDPEAIIMLVKIGARRGELSRTHFLPHLASLAKLVKVGDNKAALVLQAQLLSSRGQTKQAVQLYEQALDQTNKTGDNVDDTLDQIMRSNDDTSFAVSDAYVDLGQLYMNVYGDEAKAKAAFEKGAFKADDPAAYHELAAFEIDFHSDGGQSVSEKWVEYQTKAAASGHPEATHELAKFFAMSPKEARLGTTTEAFATYRRAELRNVNKSHSLPPIGPPSYMTRIYKLLLSMTANFPAMQRRERREKINRLAWALEWYDLAASGPPAQNKPPLFGYLKNLHEAGDLSATKRLVQEMLDSYPWPLSSQERRSLLNYIATLDPQDLRERELAGASDKTPSAGRH